MACRDKVWKGKGQRLASADEQVVFQTGLGVTFKKIGVIAASNCLKFSVVKFAFGGPRKLSKMRTAVFNNPEKLMRFIGYGDW